MFRWELPSHFASTLSDTDTQFCLVFFVFFLRKEPLQRKVSSKAKHLAVRGTSQNNVDCLYFVTFYFSERIFRRLLFLRFFPPLIHLSLFLERGRKKEEEVGRQHQGMDRPGVRQVPEGSGEQGKMEKTGCKIICVAPTTLAAVLDWWWWWWHLSSIPVR